MPHRRSSLFYTRGSETEPIIWLVRHEAPIRSQYRRRKLLSQPYRNLRASKTTFISEKIFASHFRRCSSVCRRSFLVFSLHPLTATLRAEKRHGIWKILKFFCRVILLPLNSNIGVQKTTSNFVFLKTFSTIWTTTLKGLKTTANCSFFKKSLYSLTATSSGDFSIPDSKKISNTHHPLNSHIGSQKTTAMRKCFFK